jgi:phage shock protein PspC (stress-responsive transcriptional regulator)
VCAGVARSAGLDPLLLRIAVVAVTVLTGGVGVPAYLVAWVLIPREPLDTATLPPGADRPGPPLDASADAARGSAARPHADVRAAWTAAGSDLRSLTTELRRPTAGADPAPGHTGTTAGGTTAGGTTAGGATAGIATGTGMPAGAAAPHTAPDGETAAEADGPTAGPAAGPAPGAIPAPRSPLSAADDAATALGDRLRTPEVQEGARRAASSVTQAVTASVDELARRVRRDRS